jgi:hypothetical protein
VSHHSKQLANLNKQYYTQTPKAYTTTSTQTESVSSLQQEKEKVHTDDPSLSNEDDGPHNNDDDMMYTPIKHGKYEKTNQLHAVMLKSQFFSSYCSMQNI